MINSKPLEKGVFFIKIASSVKNKGQKPKNPEAWVGVFTVDSDPVLDTNSESDPTINVTR